MNLQSNKKRARNFIYVNTLRVLRYSGFLPCLHRINRHKAIVLSYHGVVPEIPEDETGYLYRNFVTVRQFEEQLQIFFNVWRPLKCSDFWEQGNDVGGGGLVTFDDGYRNNFKYAFPILRKYNLQACFFLQAENIGSRNFLWTDRLGRLLFKTKKATLDLVPLQRRGVVNLQNRKSLIESFNNIRQQLKEVSVEERDMMVAWIESELDDVPSGMLPEDEDRYLFMTWDDILMLHQAGHYIGSHTHTHPILAQTTEKESLHEFSTSKRIIKKRLIPSA